MRVGTRIIPPSNAYPNGDHPHACGDKVIFAISVNPFTGSSPCVWGQVLNKILTELRNGIIPMRVGTSCNLLDISARRRDHPHACGDKQSNYLSSCPCLGSSPCVWGQEKQKVPRETVLGIIPMRVGTSGYAVNRCKVPKDHPHACGDKQAVAFFQVSCGGSSPCVWGQDADRLYEYDRIRIIPMRVGTSSYRHTVLSGV